MCIIDIVSPALYFLCPGTLKKYDALHIAVQHKELINEAVTRQKDFDGALGSFLQPLGELEDKCDRPTHILKRGETVRVRQEEELVCGGEMVLKASMVSTSMHERMLSSCTLSDLESWSCGPMQVGMDTQSSA